MKKDDSDSIWEAYLTEEVKDDRHEVIYQSYEKAKAILQELIEAENVSPVQKWRQSTLSDEENKEQYAKKAKFDKLNEVLDRLHGIYANYSTLWKHRPDYFAQGEGK